MRKSRELSGVLPLPAHDRNLQADNNQKSRWIPPPSVAGVIPTSVSNVQTTANKLNTRWVPPPTVAGAVPTRATNGHTTTKLKTCSVAPASSTNNGASKSAGGLDKFLRLAGKKDGTISRDSLDSTQAVRKPVAQRKKFQNTRYICMMMVPC